MKKLRKVLVASVMAMTVLSMSVVAAPDVNAASDGDLIKTANVSAVYYLSGGKRYVFPNEDVFFSWYSDFSSVVEVSQAELESYGIGSIITMRPGTKLVQEVSMETPWSVVSSKVYAVEPDGNLVQIPDADTAVALYGANWEAMISGVPSSYFTSYTDNGSQASDDVYPAGTLVKFGEDATVYYIDADGSARPVADEAAFLANRFNWDNVITSSLAMPSEGSSITGAEAAITDTASGSGGTVGAGTGLTVSLSGDTPGSANLPSSATLIPVLTVNLKAANDGDVTVKNLVFTRTGVGNDSEVTGAYVYMGDERLTNKRTINTTDHTITFTAVNLVIPAGMTKTITLRVNSGSSSTGNHTFGIAANSDVVTNGAVVSGSFPVDGNAMAFNNIDAAGVTFDAGAGTNTYKVGETNVNLGEFTIANSSSNEAVMIHRIRLKQNGTGDDDVTNNYSLELDGEIVKEGVSMDDKYVDFMLDTPFELKKSKTITAIVRGDIVTGISKTIQLYLKNDADVEVRGTAYGDNYSPSITNTVAASGSDAADTSTIQGSEINVSFDGPLAADTKDDVDDLVLANFKISSANLDVDIETMRVVVTMGGACNGASDILDNVEMVDDANGVSFSVADNTSSSTAQNYDFENILIQSGVSYNFEIRGDVPDAVPAGCTYLASIDLSDTTGTITARFQDEDETLVEEADYSSSSLTGKTMTVASPKVTLSKVTTNNATVVKNADGVLLYKGKITANNVDDLKVSRLRFDGTIGDLGNGFDQDYERLYLYKVNADGTETELDDESSLSNAYVTFSSFTLNIPKGVSNGIYVTVRGDVKNSPTGTTTEVGFGAYNTHTVKDGDNNQLTTNTTELAVTTTKSHVTTVATEGTYTLAVDTELPSINHNKNILAGEISLIGRMKFTATKENAIVEDLLIQNGGTSDGDTLGRVYVFTDEEMTNSVGNADVSSNYAFIEDLNVEIPTSGITYLYLGGMVKGIDYSDSPGADATAAATTTVKLRVVETASGYSTKVLGKDTGEELSFPGASSYTNTSTVLGAMMSNITSDFSSATLVNGTAKDIFSFKVTAPDSNNVDSDGTDLGIKLATTTFTIATSGSIHISSFKVERVGGSGEQTAIVDYDNAAGTLDIGFQHSFSSDTDLIIRPGDTAEYIIRATVAGAASSGDSLQVTIEDVDTTVDYTHNTGVEGTDGPDTIAIHPLLSGISSVRGGTLVK